MSIGHLQPPRNTTTQKVRRLQVLDLSLAGASQRKIADTLKISKTTAKSDLDKALGELAAEHHEEAAYFRAKQTKRYGERRQWDRERLIDAAEENLAGAREAKQFGSANGALELIGRVTGLLNERQQQQTVTVTRITVVTTDAAMPRAEIIEAHRPSLEAPEP